MSVQRLRCVSGQGFGLCFELCAGESGNASGLYGISRRLCGTGAIAMGFPVITNEDTFRIPKSLIVQRDFSKFCVTSLEARGITGIG